jgi:hypothetical protein
VHGVDWTRDRHRFNGRSHAFAIDVLQLKFAGTKRTSWHAVIVSEWGRFGHGEWDARSTKWLKAISGKPSDVTAWMRRYRTLKTGKPIGSPATESRIAALKRLEHSKTIRKW